MTAKMQATPRIQLGLIGDNIRASRAPDLHRIAGEACGLDVRYDRLVPPQLGQSFDEVFDWCRHRGYRGLNITYPYKETVVRRVEIPDDLVRRMGAVNTLVFEDGRALGYNTDHTGFVSAYLARFRDDPPGNVAMVGAGGVGRAVAFGLVALGADRLAIIDRDASKAEALAVAVRQAAGARMTVLATSGLTEALVDADGIVNCTQVGMIGYPGSPVPAELLAGRRWGFEAIYTPLKTQFKSEAEATGVNMLGGFELFLHQGVHAFRIFTGQAPPDLSVLRDRLSAAPDPE